MSSEEIPSAIYKPQDCVQHDSWDLTLHPVGAWLSSSADRLLKSLTDHP